MTNWLHSRMHPPLVSRGRAKGGGMPPNGCRIQYTAREGHGLRDTDTHLYSITYFVVVDIFMVLVFIASYCIFTMMVLYYHGQLACRP